MIGFMFLLKIIYIIIIRYNNNSNNNVLEVFHMYRNKIIFKTFNKMYIYLYNVGYFLRL